MTEQVKVLEMSNSDKEDTMHLRKTTLDLLPDAANNISRLEVSRELRQLLELWILTVSLYLLCHSWEMY